MTMTPEPPPETPLPSAAPVEPASESTEETTPAAMEQLLEEYSGQAAPTTGEIRSAAVVKITADGVVVDLGMKSEGLVPLAEFIDDAGTPSIASGETIEVLVEGSQAREGYVPCSSEGAHRLRLWELVETAYQEQQKVRCRVTNRVKGGFEVEINLPGAHERRRPLQAFLPASQVDLRPVRHWEGFLNRDLPARIIKLNRRRGNLVVSRRALLEEERVQKQKLLEEVLKEGAVLTGKVKNLTDYGAFVDLGGVDGLVHITDLSYRRTTHPSEVVQVGEEVKVKVLKVDKEKQRISLSLKQLQPDPWQEALKQLRVGERVRGRVTHLVDYGAFVELLPGVEGLIHVSELSWTKRIHHPSQILNEGDAVEAAVLDIQPNERRISLGLRQTEPDPFLAVAGRFPPGSVVKGRVSRTTDFGLFLELEPGVEGLVPASELGGRRRGKGGFQPPEPGQEVDAKVLKADVLNRRLSLSLKDLTPDPWATYASRLRVDHVVKGKISRRAKFGFFVELAEGVEGLCHNSEIPEEGDKPEVGQEHEFKIVKLNLKERRIGLSLKAMASEHERRAVDEYRSGRTRSTATLEEILTAKGLGPGAEKS